MWNERILALLARYRQKREREKEGERGGTNLPLGASSFIPFPFSSTHKPKARQAVFPSRGGGGGKNSTCCPSMSISNFSLKIH